MGDVLPTKLAAAVRLLRLLKGVIRRLHCNYVTGNVLRATEAAWVAGASECRSANLQDERERTRRRSSLSLSPMRRTSRKAEPAFT